MYPTRIFYRPADKTKPVLELADENYRITAESLEGWGATLEDIVEETAVIPGNIVLGQKVLSTNINFQVLLTASAGVDFDILYRRLRSSFSRIAAGTLSVVTPGVGMRSIKCRLAEPITPPRVDPRSATHALVDVHLIADKGLWYQENNATFDNPQINGTTLTTFAEATNFGCLTSYPMFEIRDDRIWANQSITELSLHYKPAKSYTSDPWIKLVVLPQIQNLVLAAEGSDVGIRWNASPLDFANPTVVDFIADWTLTEIKTYFLQSNSFLSPVPILPNQTYKFKLEAKFSDKKPSIKPYTNQGFVSVPSFYLDPWSDE